MKKTLFFIAVIGAAIYGTSDYSYADNSNNEKILLYMCLEKERHGLENDCTDIQHNLTDSYTVKSSDIGIVLSNSCMILINSNMTGCPNYDLLQSIYPSAIVNPDSNIISKIRLITMSPDLPEFKNSNSTKTTLHNNSFEISFAKSAYVDDSCENAMITSDLSLLGNVIWHMCKDCEKDNLLKSTIQTIAQDAIPFDHDESTSWNELQYWERIVEECRVKC